MNQRFCYEKLLGSISLFSGCLACCLGIFLQSRSIHIAKHGQNPKKQQLKVQEKQFSLQFFPILPYDWSLYALSGLQKMTVTSIQDAPSRDWNLDSKEELELSWGESALKRQIGELFPLWQKDSHTLLCLIDEGLKAHFSVLNDKEEVILSLEKKLTPPLRDLSKQELLALKKNSFWGIDQLQKTYAERPEYKTIGVIKREEGSFEALKVGDHLDSTDLVIRVKDLQPQSISLQAWSLDGKRSQTVNLPITGQKGAFLAKLPQILRIRGPQECSIKFGKQRAFVQMGDWWIQKGNLWEKVDESKRLKNVLDYKEGQDLIIFDEIAFEEKGIFIKGTYFDPSRTQIQHFALPLVKREKPKTAAIPKPERAPEREPPKKLEPKNEVKK